MYDTLYDLISFFGFLFILIAAFTISSKYVVNPKVRASVFISYLVACGFLATNGIMNEDGWFIAQQVVLMAINVRGIYRAFKDIKAGKQNEV